VRENVKKLMRFAVKSQHNNLSVVIMTARLRVKCLALDGRLREIFLPLPPIEMRAVVQSMLTAQTTIERSLDDAEIMRAFDAIRSDMCALVAAKATRDAMTILEASEIVLAFDVRTIESVRIMLSAGHA
jgi:hypothetical protein